MIRSLLVLSLLLVSSAFALEDTPANREIQADRYLAATPPKDLFADMAEQVSKNIPVDQRESFKNTLTKNLDIDAVVTGIKKSMIAHFSADELKALADFYGSDMGKSAMKKFGAYMADAMPMIQGEMMKAIEKTKGEMSAPKK